jgi:hypothetical protein
VGQLATIKIVEDPYKDDFNNLIADLSDDIRKRFLISLSDDKINTVIDLGYLLMSQTMLFSPPNLS